MLTRTYGQTGERVSALGLGGMRFERPDDLDAMAEVVVHAYERGITYFDTAPGYCDDRSESILGAAVREIRRRGGPRFHIATKSMAASGDEVRIHLERSLERLGVDAIDFYHVWCLVQPGDLDARRRGGALDAFRQAKEEGLVRHICVSTHLAHHEVAAMLDEAEGLFEGMLIGLNAINAEMRRPGAQAAARRGLGVVTMNTLAGGLLTAHPDHFAFVAPDGEASILEAALRFNLSLPEVTTALVGARNKADVDSAVDAVERLRPLDGEALDARTRSVGAHREGYCTACNYCKDCPEGIPVMRLMEAYNRHLLSGGDPKTSLERLQYYWGIPDVAAVLASCTQCRQCERACTQHLPILERFDQLRVNQQQLLDTTR